MIERDDLAVKLRELLATLDELGLTFAAIRIAEAIEILEQAEPPVDPE